MVLCWRRHGRAGGCRIPFEITDESFLYIQLVLPVIRKDNIGCCFWWLIKQSKHCTLKTEYWSKILKYQKFVKQTRDKQDIRGKNRKILETKNKQNQPNDVTLYIESWESRVWERKRSLADIKSASCSICSANVLSTSHSPLCVQAPTGSDACLINRFQSYLVKLKRAQGGCLGTKSRWKTW